MAFVKTSVAVGKPSTFQFESQLPGDEAKPNLPDPKAENEEEDEEEDEPTASAVPSAKDD